MVENVIAFFLYKYRLLTVGCERLFVIRQLRRQFPPGWR
jgi:hypothetical protein